MTYIKDAGYKQTGLMPDDKPIKMRRYVIAFSGPPRSGKDTAVQAVCMTIRERANWLAIRHIKLSDPLKKGAHALFSAFHSPDFYDRPENSQQKDLPSGDFFGMSPREVYIALSEEFLKKAVGPEVLGYIARKNMIRMSDARVFVFSDAGFVPEWKPIVDYVGQENFLLVEIHADGKDFSNDSRGYIGDELKALYPKMKLVKLNNTIGTADDREMFRTFAQGAAVNFLRHELKDEE